MATGVLFDGTRPTSGEDLKVWKAAYEKSNPGVPFEQWSPYYDPAALINQWRNETRAGTNEYFSNTNPDDLAPYLAIWDSDYGGSNTRQGIYAYPENFQRADGTFVKPADPDWAVRQQYADARGKADAARQASQSGGGLLSSLAPIALSFALGPAGLGIGSGLGAIGGGALVGGLTAGLTGGDPLKGALFGGLGGGVSNWASGLEGGANFVGPMQSQSFFSPSAIAGAVGNAGISGLSGGDPLKSLLTSGVTSGIKAGVNGLSTQAPQAGATNMSDFDSYDLMPQYDSTTGNYDLYGGNYGYDNGDLMPSYNNVTGNYDLYGNGGVSSGFDFSKLGNVASSLGGKAVDWLMGPTGGKPGGGTNLGALLAMGAGGLIGGMNGSQQSGTSTTTQTPWAAQQPYLMDMFDQGSKAYTATKGVNPLQTQALTMAGQGNPLQASAQDTIQKSIDGTLTNPYLGMNNPYLQSSIDNANSDVNRAMMPMLNQANRASGSFGNSGVADIYSRNMADQFGRNATNARMADYSNQQNLAEAGINRRLTSAFNSPQFANNNLATAQNMYSLGGQAQAQPFDALKNYQSVVGGSNFGSTTNTPIYTNQMAGLLGGAATGAGIYQSLFKNA